MRLIKKLTLNSWAEKQKIISGQAEANKDLNAVADKTRKLDVGKINS